MVDDVAMAATLSPSDVIMVDTASSLELTEHIWARSTARDRGVGKGNVSISSGS